MSEQNIIPLFPLSLVACPCEPIALHIFEPRYMQMMGDLKVQAEPPWFGILLQDDKGLAEIGCAVEWTETVNEYPQGQMDIRTVGRQRFRVLRYIEGQPYLRGEVVCFEDEAEALDVTLSKKVLALHDELVELAEAPALSLEERRDLSMLSFKMAHSSGLCVADKQRLMEMRRENQRLEMLGTHFGELIPKLRSARQIRERICQNGHFVKPPGIDLN